VRSIEKAFRQFRPPLAALIDELSGAFGTEAFEAAFERVYGGLEKISIDYAVMEKADNVVMVKGAFKWDDVGSWPALENHFPRDDQQNTAVGDVVALDACNNIVFSRDRLTALIGVNDLIVVHAAGATLVCSKDRAQDIKKIVQDLREQPPYAELV
jgi:mannose-1-phosphate guanylyltransferase